MSILNRLTEGIVNRDLQKEGAALRSKWERTGLLEGLGDERTKDSMSVLLENQAKELLRESSTMQSGDVEGFAAVAFPIVRRVFGGLIANELVSVQPMSLPSGLIFFLDFTFENKGAARGELHGGNSLYGGGVVGQEVTGGVDLGKVDGRSAERGFYSLNNGYSSATGSLAAAAGLAGNAESNNASYQFLVSGTFGGTGSMHEFDGTAGGARKITQLKFDKLCRFDPDFISGTTNVAIGAVAVSASSDLDTDNLIGVNISGAPWTTAGNGQGSCVLVRRLTTFSGSNNGLHQAGDAKDHILLFAASIDGLRSPSLLKNDLKGISAAGVTVHYPRKDNLGNVNRSNAQGAIVGATDWPLENEGDLPEIDIKVDSVSVTAVTKKLKAKWTPELGQDLNAYHNLDAEVELTSILSEQIALEIDREILSDLVQGAKAGKYYWSRSPGMFLNRESGEEIGATSAAPDFTGTVSEWYETLIETINDISAQIHRKTLRGGANFVVCSPEVASILEFTAGYRASVTVDSDRGTVGAVKVGNLSKKWDVYVDPYFPRNVVLVGRKGNSFLESGYVYAPYVPLQVTPTIFGVEDFVPRKGVMTRYAKKMVRPDMYGLVICRGLLGLSGN